MAKFRANHQRVSGAGKVRMIIWIMAMVIMIVMIWYWMMDVRDAAE